MDDPVKNALQANPNLVVKFYKQHCPYCDYLRPIFESVANKSGNDIEFMAIEITPNAEYFKETYDFSTVPTVIYFKDGKPVKQHGSENMTIKNEDIKKNIKDIYHSNEK